MSDPKPNPYQVGQAIRAYREHLGWTQQHLATVLQVPQSRISRVEAGAKIDPKIIAQHLGEDVLARILSFAKTCSSEPPEAPTWQEPVPPSPCPEAGPLCEVCQRRLRSIRAMYGLSEAQAAPWLGMVSDALRGLCRLGV